MKYNTDFFNEWHLGDCTLQLYYQRKLADVNIKSVLYCDLNYIRELSNHIIGYEHLIQIKPLYEKPNNAINTWIGDNDLYFITENSWDYNNFYLYWFKILSKKVGISCPINSMLSDYEEIKRNIPDDSYDILFINSEAYSNRIPHVEKYYTDLAMELAKKYKILTTQKIEGFECTRAHDWNLVQIAGASVKCKYVIANHTSPIHLCFNKWTLPNIDKWFIIHTRDTFTFNDKIERIGSYEEFIKIKNFLLG